MTHVTYHTTDVKGVQVFYRESGPSDAPKLLLLHGFPTAGHMFRDLIPQLADRFRVVAPDLTGFGQSAMPDHDNFTYTFEALTDIVEGFTDAVGFDRYALYVFDYGAPTGFRLAVRRPEAISAIVSQNGNAYTEGLSDGWNPIRAYWKQPTQANRDAIRTMLQPETTVWQYTHGVADPSLVSPDGYTLDNHYLSRPGADASQHFWLSGAETTRSSCLLEPRRSSVTSSAQMSGCWTPVTLRSKRTRMRLPRPSAGS